MTATQIVSEIKYLPLIDKIQIMEILIQSIKNDATEKRSLAEAAQYLRSDYETNTELTAFTSLDYQDFYETR